jgi:hypothetical protein
MPVIVGVIPGSVENVAEQLLAQFLQQVVLGFKMGIEGGSADISPVDDVRHGDLMDVFLG